MNAPLDATLQQAQAVTDAIGQACDRIAPTWPLDQFIAVNPYWGWLQLPIERAAVKLGALGGTRLTMPREWFREQWQAGRFGPEHLEAVVARADSAITAASLRAALDAATPAPARLPLITDLLDAADRTAPMPWSELVTHQTSQHCAAYFDPAQARWQLDRSAGLYGSWRRQLAADRGLPWRQGRAAVVQRLEALPEDPMSLISAALPALGLPRDAWAPYLTATLLAINGWAAWCAYERWQQRLAGGDDDRIVQLLAIRLAWEWLLRDDARPAAADAAWARSWASEDMTDGLAAEQELDWLMQQALELAHQQTLCAGLVAAPKEPAPAARAQAVFCIDVRSEVFRRALESTDVAIHTRGFAGFFGLPIAYAPVGSALTRPQLPGLLSSALTVSESADDKEPASLGEVLAEQRRAALGWRQRWADLRGAAASGFSFVESCGLAYGAKLLADSLPSTATPARWEDTGLPREARCRVPHLPASVSVADAAGMAHAILNAMGLTRDFAPLVLLAGHGSQSANNPHAAGLDCGACGGQTGEVNARALAELLNRPALRAALADLGIAIPAGTHFLPALHNTTLDEVVLFDTEAVPSVLSGELAHLRAALAEAGARARAERAPALGLAAVAGRPEALQRAVRERSNDWAQVRPEWGLADNAAFIVAPRQRTRHMNLGGRSFLHDYDWRADADLKVIELIMTAPMVVTNWINLQYHASTVDNRRYGSGNKVLHNVVGGRLGVFEGNGGDLRIGLPLQSLHDGRTLRHTPLRLSVFIEAPRSMIDTIIERHAVVRDLVGNGWVHLLRIDGEVAAVERRERAGWVRA